MKKFLFPALLVVAVGGFLGYQAMGSAANNSALAAAEQAENKVTLAVSGMT